MRFAKGHGTENDFVILPDPDGELDLDAATVAALCDRRAGLGADGVLRVVRTKALGEPLAGEAADAARCEWFMDYRNADGSVAEMCGNGVRVFARYLRESALVGDTVFEVGTRAGARRVTLEDDGDVTVDMGPVRVLGPGRAELADGPVRGVRVSVGNPHLACRVARPVAGERGGLRGRGPGGAGGGGGPGRGGRVSVGNPHLACRVARPVAEVDLGRPPVLREEEFPHGANVEVFREVAPGVLEMRVYERGAAETRSCGTGIVAAAAAATPPGEDAEWTVQVPGGVCAVVLEGGAARLRGPAVIVAEGDVRLPAAR